MLCLEKCRSARLSLNPDKCAFVATSGTLLGHIVSAKGLAIDPAKVEIVVVKLPQHPRTSRNWPNFWDK